MKYLKDVRFASAALIALAFAPVALAATGEVDIPALVLSGGTFVLMGLAFVLHWVVDTWKPQLPQWVWLMVAPGVMSGLIWLNSQLGALDIDTSLWYAPLLGLAVDWVHDQIVWFQTKQ